MNYIDQKNNPNLYDNGTPFDKPEVIYNFCQGAILNVTHNIPAVIVIDGGMGSGKTTLLIHLLDVINKLTGNPIVNLDEKDNVQYSLGAEQFLKKLPLSSAKGYKGQGYDEGGDYSRKGALSKFNRAMDQAMVMIRDFGSVIIIVVHDIAKLPSEMFSKQIVTVLIHCKQRTPGSVYSTAEAYSYVNMCYVLENKKRVVVPETAYKGRDFHFRFKDLSPERSKQLSVLCSAKKRELWGDTTIKNKGYLNYKDIGNILGKKDRTVRKIISDLNIQPETNYNKRNYYSPKIIEIIQRRLKHKK